MRTFKNFVATGVVLALAACGGSDSPEQEMAVEANADSDALLSIQGELHYLDRMALAPGSTAVLELRAGAEPNARLIAEVATALGDRQVPIAFEMAVDLADWPGMEAAYFRGGIVSTPGPMRVSEVIEVAMAAGSVDLGSVRLNRVPQIAFGTSFACGERTVVFGALGEHERLVVDDAAFDMRLETSASGARYVAIDGSETEFWSRGDEATVTVNGETLETCHRLSAPALPLRALGHEPSWLILLDDLSIQLSTDFGTRQIEFPFVEPQLSAAGLRYETASDEGRLSLVLEPQPCSDTMVDLAYPFRAHYTLGDEHGAGCAGAPVDVLVGSEWMIERIGDADIVAGTQPTIEFRVEEGEGRFSGLASCNRYMGGFRITGEGLSLSPAASTLMACADEEQAAQERRLTGLLSEVYGFGIDDDGRLHLRTGGGTIVAAR